MKTRQDGLLILHKPNSSLDRKTYGQGLVKHASPFAFENTSLRGSNQDMILRCLDRHPKEITNQAHPYCQEPIGRAFNREGWLNISRHRSELIRAPTAIRGQDAILCETPIDIYKLKELKREPPI